MSHQLVVAITIIVIAGMLVFGIVMSSLALMS
jgi:hypothetical protein